MKTILRSLLTVSLLCATMTAHAGAIAKVPYRITKPGKYFLLKNLTPTATAVSPENAAIVIDAENVELDLQGFTVFANPANASITTGILVLGQEGVRIRNGRIWNFGTGLFGSSNCKDALFEGLEIKSPSLAASSRTMGTHFRACTFILDSDTGIGLTLTSSGGGPAHIVENCTFYATTQGAAATQVGLSVGGGQPAIVRNGSFIGWGRGISGNNATAAADNVFNNCVSKYDAGVSSLVGYNQ